MKQWTHIPLTDPPHERMGKHPTCTPPTQERMGTYPTLIRLQGTAALVNSGRSLPGCSSSHFLGTPSASGSLACKRNHPAGRPSEHGPEPGPALPTV